MNEFEFDTYICFVKVFFVSLMVIFAPYVGFTLRAQEISGKPVPSEIRAPREMKQPDSLLRKMKAAAEGCKMDVSRNVLARLDSQAYMNFKANFINGYRILIYSGNSREDANKAKENAYLLFPRGNVYMTYNFPTFKVRFGNFITRFSAWLAFNRLKASFPSAMVSEEIVFINP